MHIVGILLAAGRGRRFDPSGARNKLLAPLPASGNVPVAVASARAMLAVLPRVIAVVPPADGGVAQALRDLGCDVTTRLDADSGMAASLYVQHATIAALHSALAGGAAIAAPVHAGRRGNPVAFGAAHLEQLLALQGVQGARALLKAHPVTEIAVDDPGIARDIDSVADLAGA